MVKGKPKDFRINLYNASQTYFAGSDIEGTVFLELSKDDSSEINQDSIFWYGRSVLE